MLAEPPLTRNAVPEAPLSAPVPRLTVPAPVTLANATLLLPPVEVVEVKLMPVVVAMPFRFMAWAEVELSVPVVTLTVPTPVALKPVAPLLTMSRSAKLTVELVVSIATAVPIIVVVVPRSTVPVKLTVFAAVAPETLMPLAAPFATTAPAKPKLPPPRFAIVTAVPVDVLATKLAASKVMAALPPVTLIPPPAPPVTSTLVPVIVPCGPAPPPKTMPVPLAAVVTLTLVSVVVPVVLRISKAMPVAPVLLTLVMVVLSALTMTSLALPANVTLSIVVLVDGVISTPAVRKFWIVIWLIVVPEAPAPLSLMPRAASAPARHAVEDEAVDDVAAGAQSDDIVAGARRQRRRAVAASDR